MAANGRGTMRNQSRTPPFLVIGLVVALVILGFNYWRVSSRNGSLNDEAEIAYERSTDLQEQVRMLSTKKLIAEKKSETVLERVRELEGLLNNRNEELQRKEVEVSNINRQLVEKGDVCQAATDNLQLCHEELKSCKDSKSVTESRVQSLEDMITKLKAEQASMESKAQQPTECSPSCYESAKKDVLMVVDTTLGMSAIQSLYNAGLDVGELKQKYQLSFTLDNSNNMQPKVPDANIPDQQGDRQVQLGQPQDQQNQAQSQLGQAQGHVQGQLNQGQYQLGQAQNQPGVVGQAQNQPGDVGQAQNQPGDVGQAQNQPGDVGQAQNQPGLLGQALNQPGEVDQAQNQPSDVGQAQGQLDQVHRELGVEQQQNQAIDQQSQLQNQLNEQQPVGQGEPLQPIGQQVQGQSQMDPSNVGAQVQPAGINDQFMPQVDQQAGLKVTNTPAQLGEDEDDDYNDGQGDAQDVEEPDEGDNNDASIWGRVYQNVKNFVLHDDQGDPEIVTKTGVTTTTNPFEAGNNETETFFADEGKVKSHTTVSPSQHGHVVNPISVVNTSLGLGKSNSLNKTVSTLPDSEKKPSVLSSNGTALHTGSQGDGQVPPPVQLEQTQNKDGERSIKANLSNQTQETKEKDVMKKQLEYEDNDDYDAEDDDMEATGENMKTDLKFQPHLMEDVRQEDDSIDKMQQSMMNQEQQPLVLPGQ
ncbi:hypothetical protein ScPMuIL_018926 [Solemya velum]